MRIEIDEKSVLIVVTAEQWQVNVESVERCCQWASCLKVRFNEICSEKLKR